jgi:hypothetical protein
LNVARQQLMHLSLAAFKGLVRDQAFLLHLERERAVEALAVLVPDAEGRKDVLKQVQAIVGAGDPPTPAERDRLTRLSQVLSVPVDRAVTRTASGRASTAKSIPQPPVTH